MEVRKPAKFLLIIAILFYLLSAVMLYKGYDKMTNYSNPEYSFMTTHNAYVGGDAYNYIINGNYATAFFVLTLTFAMLGIGFCILAYLSKISASRPAPVLPQCTSENHSPAAENTEPVNEPVEDVKNEES